jgi:hypothetical protein
MGAPQPPRAGAEKAGLSFGARGLQAPVKKNLGARPCVRYKG